MGDEHMPMLSDERIAVLLGGVVGFAAVRQQLGIGGEGIQSACDDVAAALRELQRFRSRDTSLLAVGSSQELAGLMDVLDSYDNECARAEAVVMWARKLASLFPEATASVKPAKRRCEFCGSQWEGEPPTCCNEAARVFGREH